MTSNNAQQPEDFFPSGADRWTGYLLAYVTGLAQRTYTQEVARIGLKPLHLAILGILGQEGPMVQARLSEKLRVFKPVMVSLLNELQAMQFVVRHRPVADQRAYEVHLTDAGRERLLLAEPINRTVTQQFFRDLTDNERAQLHDLLLRLARSNSPAILTFEEHNGEEHSGGDGTTSETASNNRKRGSMRRRTE